MKNFPTINGFMRRQSKAPYLKKIAAGTGLCIRDLCQTAGFSDSCFREWESGRKDPDARTLSRLRQTADGLRAKQQSNHFRDAAKIGPVLRDSQ